jgi:hypothetical protein
MKLFERTGGHWIFYISVAYFVVGMFSIYNGADLTWAGPLYIFFLSMPFWFPPLGRSINLDVTWDQKMFNFFRQKPAKEFVDETSNVYNLPKPKAVPPVPEVTPPKKEDPAKIFYRLGLTDNNRVAFSMGYSEILMTHAGCQQMIDQLTFFQSQLYDDDGPNDDPDGGLPLPEEVEHKKVA